MTQSDLVDLDTWVLLKKAAPKVMLMSFDAVQAGIQALVRFAEGHRPYTDADGRKYWDVSLKEMLGVAELVAPPTALGRAYRSLGLTVWRKADGYHVAWSQAQLDILVKYFKV